MSKPVQTTFENRGGQPTVPDLGQSSLDDLIIPDWLQELTYERQQREAESLPFGPDQSTCNMTGCDKPIDLWVNRDGVCEDCLLEISSEYGDLLADR